MRPRVGFRNFVSRLKQVVLPAPFGPIKAWMLPRRTLRLTSLTAKNPANSLVNPWVSRMNSSANLNSPIGEACEVPFAHRRIAESRFHDALGNVPNRPPLRAGICRQRGALCKAQSSTLRQGGAAHGCDVSRIAGMPDG